MSVLFCLLAIGPLILLYQAIHWLQSGVWNPATVAETLTALGMGIPSSSWAVLQRMLDNFLSLEVSAVVFGLAVLIALVTLYRLDRADKRAAARMSARESRRRH